MVRVHQAGSVDNTVAVGVRVIAKGEVETAFDGQQVGHSRSAGAIHADLAVVVRGHEGEIRVLVAIHHFQIQAIVRRHRIPNRQRRAAHGVDTQLQAAAGNGVHIHHLPQSLHVLLHKIPGLGRHHRLPARRGFHARKPGFQQLISPLLNPARSIRTRRAAVRAVVFNPAILRGVVRRRNNQPIRQCRRLIGVVYQNGMRHQRRGREATGRIHPRNHTVTRQHLQHRIHRRARQGMGVFAHVHWPGNALLAAPVHYRLGNCQDVVAVEAAV